MLLDGDRAVLAAEGSPVARLDAKELERLAAGEWASVASFARTSLELMSLAAPVDLVQATHEAALDEVNHARLLLLAASEVEGREVRLGRVPILPARALSVAELARATFVEACVGETLGALEARGRSQGGGALGKAWARIADDEERHAELAWKTLAWAIREGGEDACVAVETAAREVEAWGLDRAYHDVVLPCLAALLEAARDQAMTAGQLSRGIAANAVARRDAIL